MNNVHLKVEVLSELKDKMQKDIMQGKLNQKISFTFVKLNHVHGDKSYNHIHA